MYCTNCGKEIGDQGEGGYCQDCELYTASPTFFKPQKHLAESTQVLYFISMGVGLLTHMFCLMFDVYKPSKDVFLYVLIAYVLAFIPLTLTFLVFVRELKRNVDHSNLLILSLPLILSNYPFFILCINFIRSSFH